MCRTDADTDVVYYTYGPDPTGAVVRLRLVTAALSDTCRHLYH